MYPCTDHQFIYRLRRNLTLQRTQNAFYWNMNFMSFDWYKYLYFFFRLSALPVYSLQYHILKFYTTKKQKHRSVEWIWRDAKSYWNDREMNEYWSTFPKSIKIHPMMKNISRIHIVYIINKTDKQRSNRLVEWKRIIITTKPRKETYNSAANNICYFSTY